MTLLSRCSWILEELRGRTTTRDKQSQPAMSYYFTILSPKDVPLFSITFGTSKAGGDGVARFRFPESAAYMNQFIVHAALDIVEEAQWTNGSL